MISKANLSRGSPQQARAHSLRQEDRMALSDQEVMGMFKDAGALLTGHFRLTSGMHSGTYFEKFQVLQHPRYVERLCKELAERFRDAGAQVVLGPTTGGVLIAYEVAKNLGTRSIFAEREGDRRVLRRGFTIGEGERVLVVDDILTTGGSVRDTVNIVHEKGGVLVGVGILVDRSGGGVDFGAPLKALLTLNVEKWDPADCPLCKQGIPIHEPGSKSLSK